MTAQPRFGFAILYPDDVQAAKRFYVDVLGLRVEREAATFVQFEHFALAGDSPVGASGKTELYWLIEDAEAAYRSAPKGSISQPLSTKPFGKVFGLRDPDGETCFVLELAKNRPSKPVGETSSEALLVRDGEMKWESGPAPGVERVVLRSENGGESVLLRFKAGSKVPVHPHPAGEHLYVITGRIRISESSLNAGDYLWTPPGVSTDAEAHDDTLLLLVKPEPKQG